MKNIKLKLLLKKMGGATGLDLLFSPKNQSPIDWRLNVRLGWCSYE